MKYLLTTFLTILLILSASLYKAQDSCEVAIPILSWDYSDSLNYGSNTNWGNNDPGCLGSAGDSYWLEFQICNSGDLNLFLQAGTGVDIDYIIYGPYTGTASCAFTSNDIVVCDYSASGFNNIIMNSVNAGEKYMMAISNYVSAQETFDLTQNLTSATTCDTACGQYVYPPEMCYVTSDPVGGYNTIYWNNDPNFVGNYIVYRESTTAGVFDSIGTVNYQDSTYLVDVGANCNQRSYKYKVGAISDSCDTYTFYTSTHETIFLQSSPNNTTGAINLSWNEYGGFPVYKYIVMRGTSLSNLTPYDSLSSSTSPAYTDVNANFNSYYYSVVARYTYPCNLLKSSDLVSSNAVVERADGVESNASKGLRVFPNPAQGQLNIGSILPINQIEIYDLSGKLVKRENGLSKKKIVIDVADLNKGIYSIRVSSKDQPVTYKTFVVN